MKTSRIKTLSKFDPLVLFFLNGHIYLGGINISLIIALMTKFKEAMSNRKATTI